MSDQRAEVSPAGLIALFEDIFQSWKDAVGAKMVIATIINLADRNIIELELKKQRRVLGLGSSKKLIIHQKREVPQDILERRIAALVSRLDVRVRDVLLSFWAGPVPKPHQDVETWIQEELVRNGLMKKIEEKKRFRTRVSYTPLPTAFSLRSRVLDLKNQLDQFQRQYPQKYKQLRYEVNIGLELRTLYPV